jgi:hypothetical protein
MERELQALLIGLAMAAILGYFTARSSNRREKIYGGTAAQIFHYIGAGLFAATPPTVLLTLILGGEFLQAVLTAVAFLAVSYGCLVAFAVIERPLYEAEQRKKQERGWTEQDARTSGL